LIYAFFNANSPETSSGWGIPTATDIAFAIGVLSIMGKRVPISVKIFLTALAIADDLGAIIVIAVFYPTHALHLDLLLIAGAIMLIILFLNSIRIRHTLLYTIAGIALWLVMLKSGVHATVAGILLAIIIPARTRISGTKFYAHSKYLIKQFRKNFTKDKSMLANHESIENINALRHEIARVSSPMQKIESSLHGFSMYIIMPLFALANAGVVIDPQAFGNIFSDLSLGIICGLVIGKPIGIFIFSFIMIKLGFSKFSDGMSWKLLLNAGIIAGIGFTMSMFVSNLAFANPNNIDTAKIAIITASALATIVGIVFVLTSSKNKTDK
jgi:NhaA family Na+:H+ antiporter